MSKTLTIQLEQLPTKKSESWRYTDVRALAGKYRIVENLLQIAAPTSGVTIKHGQASKSKAQKTAETNPDLLFESVAQTVPVTTITIKKDVQLATPIILTQSAQQKNTLARTNIQLVIEEGASARLVEKIADNTSGLFLSRIAITVEPGATLEHRVEIVPGGLSPVQPAEQNTGRGASIFMRRVSVTQDARYSCGLTTSAAGLARHDLQVTLHGPRAQAHVAGTYTARDTNLIDHHIGITHAAPHTTSTQILHGIISGQASGVFNGAITVLKTAPYSHATQLNKTLLTDPKAQMFTKPELHIDTDKVTCSHGASIGRLDEQALFYLTSRGLTHAQARQQLTTAFLNVPAFV